MSAVGRVARSNEIITHINIIKEKSMFPVKVETRILLNCPHCLFSSRYDTGFLEDCINEHREISCVACGGHFSISVVAIESRPATSNIFTP
mgnify:CR=1 FL=1